MVFGGYRLLIERKSGFQAHFIRVIKFETPKRKSVHESGRIFIWVIHFATQIVLFYEAFSKARKDTTIAKQLLRSATSVGVI